MTNSNCKIGTRTKAARRIAGMLISGTIAGTMAVGSAGTVHVAAATWQENANYIFAYLTQELGYTEAAACGIMANIRCESTFNPHAWNAGGGSYGLCQWTGGRYGRLRSWCGSNGYDYTTIDGQLAYLEYELQNHYPGVEEYLRSVENTSDGAYNAGQYYCYHFEAPASRGSVSVYRGGLASGTFWESYRPAEWYQIDGLWHYILRDGSYQTEWLSIDGETFYFDENGNRISGWRTIDGSRYFFGEDGVMATGWRKIDGRSYYFDSDGSLITGLIHNNDDWYLVDGSGNVQASADLEAFAPEWTAAEAERETALASAAEETGPKETPVHTETQPEQLAAAGDYRAGEEEAANLSAIAAAGNEPAEPEEKDDSYLAAAEAMQSAASMQQEEADEPAGPSGDLLAELPSSVLEMAGPLPALSNELFDEGNPPALPSSVEAETSVAENEEREQKDRNDPAPEAEEQTTALASADTDVLDTSASGEEQKTAANTEEEQKTAANTEEEQEAAANAEGLSIDLPSSVLEMAGPLPTLSNELFEDDNLPELPPSVETEASVAENGDGEKETSKDPASEAEEQTTALAFADPDTVLDGIQKETGNSEGTLTGIRNAIGNLGDKVNLVSGLRENEDGENRDMTEDTGNIGGNRTDDRADKANKVEDLDFKAEEDAEDGSEASESESESIENASEAGKSEIEADDSEARRSDTEADDSEAWKSETEEDDSEVGKSETEADDSEAGESETEEHDSVEKDSENRQEESKEKASEIKEEESEEKDSGNTDKESEEKDSGNTEEESEEKDSGNTEEESEEKNSGNTDKESEEKDSGNTEENAEDDASDTSDSGDLVEVPDYRESRKKKVPDNGSEPEDSNRILVTVENLENEEEEEEEAGKSEEDNSFFSNIEDARRKILGENKDTDAKIILTLDKDHLPVLTEEDLEDPDALVQKLYAEEVLRAVSGTGLDLTPEVIAFVERSEKDNDIYTITFSVEFGGESAEISTEVTVEAETQQGPVTE